MILWAGVQLAQAMSAMFGETGVGAFGFVAVAALGFGLMIVRWRLRLERPWLWWPVFGAPGAIVRMMLTWRATMEGMGLSVPAKRFSEYAVVGNVMVKGEPLKMVAPRRTGVRISGCALVVTVKLLPGQTPLDWDKAAEAISHQWRVHRVRSVSKRAGFVTLTGLGFDPLRFPPAPKKPKALGSTGTSFVTPFRPRNPLLGRNSQKNEVPTYVVVPGVLVVDVGVQEDGEPWVIDMTAWAHFLVTGATRSGKSTLTVRFLSELARRPVALVGIDAKNGLELAPFAPRLSALAVNRAEAAAAIEALIGVMLLRTVLLRENGARSIWELPVLLRPAPIVLIIDEIAELFLATDKEGKEEANRCVTGLVRLGQLGAGLGVHLWVSGQRFGSDLGPGATLLRAQLSGRICHRVADAETAGMTLAGLPKESIVEAQRISTDLAGVAVVGDDSGTWLLGRSHQTSMSEATALAAETASLTVPMPEVTAAIDRVRSEKGSLW